MSSFIIGYELEWNFMQFGHQEDDKEERNPTLSWCFAKVNVLEKKTQKIYIKRQIKEEKQIKKKNAKKKSFAFYFCSYLKFYFV